MHVTLVNIWVRPEHTAAFVAATLENQQASQAEPNNLRFDFLQASDDPAHFLLYEAYASEMDALAHKQTDHYLAWRDRVADWMARPRQGAVFQGVLKVERGQW